MAKTLAEYIEAEGFHEGEVRARHQWLLRLLRIKFPRMGARMVQRIEATEQLDLLDAWFDQALVAKKLGDLTFAAARGPSDGRGVQEPRRRKGVDSQ